MSDVSLTFDHWWYFISRLQQNELAQWNPFYLLGRIAVQWNYVPVNLLTPVLYFFDFDYQTFLKAEVFESFLCFLGFYFTARILNFGKVASMLVVAVLAMSGFRYWLACPQFSTFLFVYPIAVALLLQSIKNDAFEITRFGRLALLFAIALLGLRLETLVYSIAFISCGFIAWLTLTKPEKPARALLVAICGLGLSLAANAWQIDFLFFSTLENSRVVTNVGRQMHLSFVDLKWLLRSVIYQPLLITALFIYVAGFITRITKKSGSLLKPQNFALLIALFSISFFIFDLLPVFLTDYEAIAKFRRDSHDFQTATIDALWLLCSLALYWLINRGPYGARKQLGKFFDESVLFFLVPAVTQYSWKQWPINQNIEYFFMHPLLNWIMPLAIPGLLKRWGSWPLWALFLYHFIGETLCLPMFESLGINWNPPRAAFAELPFQILVVGECLLGLVALFHSFLPKIIADNFSIKYGSQIIISFAVALVVAKSVMPMENGYFTELFPFAKIPAGELGMSKEYWMDRAFSKSNLIAKQRAPGPQLFRTFIEDETWQNYPNMKYDFLPSYSQTLNTAPIYSSEIPYHLKLMLLGPDQLTYHRSPPHPEMNPLLPAKASIALTPQKDNSDVYDYLAQVLLLPHHIRGYPVGQLMAEVGSLVPRAFITSEIRNFKTDAEEYAAIRSEYQISKTLPIYVTTQVSPDLLVTATAVERTEPLKANVRVIVDKPENVLLETTSNKPGYLVLLDQYEKNGWTATLNVEGKASTSPIFRAYLGARAVKIPVGTSTTEFKFELPGLKFCLWLSGLAWISLLVCASLGILRKRSSG